MEDKKRQKLITIIEAATVAGYILLVLKSTVGAYIKETKKLIKKEAKRRDRLNKEKHKKRMKKCKRKTRRR